MTDRDAREPGTLTPERELVLGFVRATAGSPADLGPRLAEADPARLMQLLLRTRMTATFGHWLSSDHATALPAWFTEQLAAVRDAARRNGLLQDALVNRATRALTAYDVRVMPLKGAGFAEAVHGDLGARQSSDIDLLVDRDRLDQAVIALTDLGWREQRLSAPPSGLPRLHRVMEHSTLPPIELHWRVHWYEESFSQRALARAVAGPDGRLHPVGADELAFLLLFLARDGFAGLRQVVDLAAWWCARGRGTERAAELRALADTHPSLDPALTVAAAVAEPLIGLTPQSLAIPARPLTGPQRMALKLANPWLEGSGQQIDAEVSLVDGLLAPPGAARAFVRRRIVPPAHETLLRHPELEHAGQRRLLAARCAHALRVLGRYVLAGRRLLRRRQA